MSKTEMIHWMEKNVETFTEMAKAIWDHPEVGYTEQFASRLQSNTLQAEGFKITSNIGEIPTAFMAEYGSGKPIIGLLGEFDALPGLSQQIKSVKDPVIKEGAGHGCGHNLLGTAGVAAAIALSKQMEKEGLPGTIRYYGCPAEELLSGKTFMAREGVFDDLDSVLTWHPGTSNYTVNISMQALTAVEFHFSGRTAHAGAAPHLGRSALDAVELMNVGSNYLREHVLDGTRIHYQITNGGEAPNIVPDKASVYYFLRAANRKQVDELLERIIKVAQGAAMMTETTTEWTIKAGCYDTLPNLALNTLMYDQVNILEGTFEFTEEEQRFAEKLKESLDSQVLDAPNPTEPLLGTVMIHDKSLLGYKVSGSSDIGDVSWIAPMGQIMTTCAPAGVQIHTWQATASFGSSIGMKGMYYAAKIMALSAYDLLLNVDGILERAKDEFMASTKGATYKSGIPQDVKPPVVDVISSAK